MTNGVKMKLDLLLLVQYIVAFEVMDFFPTVHD